MEWPELEEAKRQRDEERERRLHDIDARQLADRVNAELENRFWVASQLEPWKAARPAIERLAREWGQPVKELLSMMGHAYWDVDAETERRLSIEFKLVPRKMPHPPFLCWEMLYQHFMVRAWFILQLEVDTQGRGKQFWLEANENRILEAPLEMEALKEMLVEGFRVGSLRDLQRKPLLGENLAGLLT